MASPHINNNTVENVGLAWRLATNETFSTFHAGKFHEEEKTENLEIAGGKIAMEIFANS